MKPSIIAYSLYSIQWNLAFGTGKQADCCLLEKLNSIFSNDWRERCAIELAFLLMCATEYSVFISSLGLAMFSSQGMIFK